jgi:hypothetical protein
MRKKKLIFLILIALTLAFTPAGNAAPEEITLSQYSGIVGTKVTINGTGFAPNSPIFIFWDFTDLLNETQTDINGNFTATFTVPEATNGDHLVIAMDDQGGMATATFTVVASITLNPNHGVVESTFDITGTGFSRNAIVHIYWDNTYIGWDRTNNRGTFTLADVDVPESTYGRHTVTAIDADLNMASAIFFVEPDIQIDPDTAYVGAQVTVTCTGYSANATISIIWDPAQSTETILLKGVTTPTGSFTGEFTVPEAVNGNHFITGLDSNAVTATTTFTIAAYLFLAPSSGYVGETVNVYGTGFSATSTITLKWGTTPITTNPPSTQTNQKGSFITTFQTPQATAGPHIVEATDNSNVSASASFNIAPHLTLNPDNGPVNTSSIAICTGFSPNIPIDIIWDLGLPTQQLLSSGTTNSTGTYTTTITVPSTASNGTHIVGAIDWNGNRATTLFWIGPRITLNPSSGYVGTQTTIYGLNFAANTTVTLLWDDQTIGTASTNGNGSFTYLFTIPHAINGMHKITAIDAFNNTAYNYYIIYANITISTTSGYVGDTITITGTGFANNTIVTIYWDGVKTQRSEISNNVGDVTLTFIIPQNPQGTHNIQCIDSNSNPSNTAQFIINPKIELSKTYGYVGDTITINGTGFAANSLVTITWDNISQYTAETSNNDGSVLITYLIPSSPTGIHVISAYDELLNMADGKNFTVLAPEKPTPLTPANGTYTNINKPTFSWTSVTNAANYSLQYSQDKTFSTGVTTITGISTIQYTLTTPLNDGKWYWRIQALDAYSNPSGYSDAYIIVIDTVPPTSTLTPLSQYQNSQTFNLAYTSSDNLSGIAYIELYFSYNGGNFEKYGTYSTQNGTITFNAPYGDGQYSFYILAVDNAGNIQDNFAQTQTLVDTVSPTSYLTALPQYTAQRTFNLTYTASDSGSGVSHVILYYSIDGGNTWTRYGEFTESPISFTAPSDGRYMFYTIAVDNAGNIQTIQQAQAETTVDTVPPTTFQKVQGTLGNQGWHTTSVTITLTSLDTLSGVHTIYFSINNGPWQMYNGPINITTNGIHTVNFYAVDNAGNPETSNTITIKIDKTPPLTTSTAQETWYSQTPVTFNLTATDDQSGVAATYYRLDGTVWTKSNTVTITEEGIHIVEFYSIDIAGNTETTEKIYIKIDSTPPTTTREIQGTLGNEGWYTSSLTITLTSTDATSGINITYFSINNGSWQQYAGPLNITSDGIHTIRYYSIDNADNAESTKTITIKIDKTAPHTTSDADEIWYSQSPLVINLTATDSQSGVAITYYRLDGTVWTASNTVTITGDGIHIVEFYSIDIAGNIETTEKIYIKIDSAPPAVLPQQIIQDNIHLAGTYKFALAVEDEAGISSVTVYIDNNEVQKLYMNPQTGLYEFLLNTTTLQDGEHEIAFHFTDNGNHTVTVKRTFVVDNTAPLIESVTPDFSTVQTGSINIEISIVEETNISTVYLSIDDGEWVAMTYNSGEKKAYYKLETNAGDNGVHNIKIKLVDTLGNTKIYEYPLTVDNPTYTPYLFFIATAIGIALLCLGVRASRKPIFKTPTKIGGEITE